MKKLIQQYLDRRLKKWCIKNVPKPAFPGSSEYYQKYYDWIKSV